MKLKTVEVNGQHYAALENGMPVYVHDNGQEVPFDAPGTVATITRLNGEAKNHREAKQEALNRLAAFSGITDPEAAIAALDTISRIDQKKLIDAGEVNKVREEVGKVYQSQLEEANGRYKTLEQQLYNEKIGGSFARSKFIAEKLAIPVDMVQSSFGGNFKIEDGQIVPYDQHGNKIFSKSRPGEIADFEEGIELIIDNYAYKDNILKANQQSGGGSKPGAPAGPAKGNMAGDKADRVAAIASQFPELARS